MNLFQEPPEREAATTDDDLPGMWSKSDFEGGDPDERSYAEREAADYVSAWPIVGWTTPDDIAVEAGFMKPEADTCVWQTGVDIEHLVSLHGVGTVNDDGTVAFPITPAPPREYDYRLPSRVPTPFVDEFSPEVSLTDLQPFQDAINKSVRELAAIAWSPDYEVVWRDPVSRSVLAIEEYRVYQRYVLGVENEDVNPEFVSLLIGYDVRPDLAHQQIPTKGAE